MKTRVDLKQYEVMYENFDGGHDMKHLKEVRDFAMKLGKLYAPEKLELIWVAATLHDIGLSVERENHEIHGAEIFENDENFRNTYSKEEFEEIVEAIREHRASSGNPVGVVSKIVSDSDKVSSGTNRSFQRAYEWGRKHMSELDHNSQMLRAATHLQEKFGLGGTGTRLYFEESKSKQDKTYAPIFEALKDNDLVKMEEFLVR